jgi:DNA replication and repair protein RecF
MTFVKQLVLRNFRNYVDEVVAFTPGINLIYGRNGSGKTNLLEALYLLSTGRSFRTSHLTDLIRKGASYFYIEAVFEKEEIHQTLSIGFDGKNRKIQANRSSLLAFSHLLGRLPSVLYAPTDSELISGAPSERRRFLNIQLSQRDPTYVHHLIRYHKAMKSRNILLKQKHGESLEAWEEIMAHSASYLMRKREKLIEELQPKLESFIKILSDTQDPFILSYAPSIKTESPEEIKKIFYNQRKKELILGTTLIGPHRDDFLISYENKEAKVYASEGQKRTCIAALKMAERAALAPDALFAIDDFGIHLDETRKELFHATLSSLHQVFLTVPSEEKIRNLIDSPLLYVDRGTVTHDANHKNRAHTI